MKISRILFLSLSLLVSIPVVCSENPTGKEQNLGIENANSDSEKNQNKDQTPPADGKKITGQGSDSAKQQDQTPVDPKVESRLTQFAHVLSSPYRGAKNICNFIGDKESALLFALTGYIVSQKKIEVLKGYKKYIDTSLGVVTTAVVLYGAYKLYKSFNQNEEEEEIYQFNLSKSRNN